MMVLAQSRRIRHQMAARLGTVGPRDAGVATPRTQGMCMSRTTETMFANARWSLNGMTTGEPHAPGRHTRPKCMVGHDALPVDWPRRSWAMATVAVLPCPGGDCAHRTRDLAAADSARRPAESATAIPGSTTWVRGTDSRIISSFSFVYAELDFLVHPLNERR